MDNNQNIAQLMAISPETLADDLKWFLEGFDAPSLVSDIEPWRNAALSQYFEHTDGHKRQDRTSQTVLNLSHKVPDDAVDMRTVLQLNDIIKELDTARENWQDDMLETFIRHEEEICEFSTDMNYCDSTLKLIEEALMKHYKSLEAASTDIKNLHSESAELSACLDNRQAFLNALQSFLDDIAIPPPLIKTLCNEPIGEGYVEHLHKFHQKSHKMKTLYDGAPYPSLHPTKIQVKKLELAIVGRIYEFMRIEIAKLATPKANIQMIQNTHFIKLRPLIAFVNETSPNYAAEIKNQYAKTLRKIYYHLFSSYYATLEQFCTRNHYKDVSVLTTRSTKCPKGYFLLEDRDSLVLAFKDDPMVPTGIQPESLRVESVLKSFLKLLVDTASSEYMFISEFFERVPTTMFNYIFEDTIIFLRSRVDNLLKVSCDVVMLTTVTLLLAANRKVMNDRGIRALDDALGKIQLDVHSRAMHHVQNMAKHIMSYTLQASSSTIDLCIPGIHAINLSNLVHSMLRLRATQEKLDIAPIAFDPVLHLIQVSLAALTLRGRELSNPIKMNVFVIANCSAFLNNLEQFSQDVADFEHARNKHVKAYVNNYVRGQFEGIIQLGNVITPEDMEPNADHDIPPTRGGTDQNPNTPDGQPTAGEHQNDGARWQLAAEDFVKTARSKFEAIRSKVELHFVQREVYQLVIDAILETIEYIYTTFHQNVERIAKYREQDWAKRLPHRNDIRQWLLNNPN
ncbi:hypothetical protein BaOVIS_002140 [Babesia ovis]|uniref:Vps52 / Sac2 family protein n=1 Tax=Babesia ovis TaxID=5869 RepID=A0A9W5T7S6_BABOV|nr:hypothetical protein BaOVIS_002140 [Babesia ovis]